MTKEKKKGAQNKDLHYVLRKGKLPGIYKTYNEALSRKHPWDSRPLIRVFKTYEEAVYYFKHGEEMPPPPPKPESKSKELWTDEDVKRWKKESEEILNNPDTDVDRSNNLEEELPD